MKYVSKKREGKYLKAIIPTTGFYKFSDFFIPHGIRTTLARIPHASVEHTPVLACDS